MRAHVVRQRRPSFISVEPPVALHIPVTAAQRYAHARHGALLSGAREFICRQRPVQATTLAARPAHAWEHTGS